MIDKVLQYRITHDVSKEQGAAHFRTSVYADLTLIEQLRRVQVTINNLDFSTEIVDKEGNLYPKARSLDLRMNFLCGLSIIGIYPDILVSFEGKRVNFVNSFTYSMDFTKENRLPLIHFAFL